MLKGDVPGVLASMQTEYIRSCRAPYRVGYPFRSFKGMVESPKKRRDQMLQGWMDDLCTTLS